MKRIAIFSFILLGLSFGLRAQLPASYAAQLKRTLDSMCTKYQVHGATAAVYVPGYGIWEGAYGESHPGVPMSSSMVLPLNSNTKTYVAAALLKLQEAGKLSLDDTIGKWIRNKPYIRGTITIRQMLNHTSGIFSYTDTLDFGDSIMADFSRVWQPEEMLKFIGPELFAPGTDWYYSNTNYLLAGMIISQVSGKPVEQALRDLVLTPAGLSNTWFYPQETPTAVVPHFWFVNGSAEVDGVVFGYSPVSFYSGANSAGALFATAKDNVLFWQKLSSGAIVNAGSLAEWRNTITLNGSIGYGLGMFRYRNFNSRLVYEHGGTGAGAINENLVDSASGVCISLLTNQERSDNDVLFNFIVKALHRVTLAPPTSVAAAPVMADWKLYPVPASSVLNLAGDGLAAAGLRCRIMDLSGRALRDEPVSNGRVALDGLGTGSYWLELRSETGTLGTRRFEVVR